MPLEAAFCEPKLCSWNQSQPQCVFSQENNACLVLTWPYAPHRAKEGLGCLWLRGPCCMAGGLLGIKPTPNVFSNGEKADVAGESLVYTGPSNPHLASSGGTAPNGDLRMATNSLWEAAFGKPKLCLGNLPQPQCVFAPEGNTCLVLTWPYVPIGPRRVWAASGSVGPAALVGGLRGLKPTPNVFSFGEKADLGRKCLDCPGPSNPPFPSSGGTPPTVDLRIGTNSLGEAAFCEPKLCSGNKPQPQCVLALESNPCLLLT